MADMYSELHKMKNFAEILRSTAARLPDKTAFVCGGERRTFGQLERESNDVAAALEAEGIRPGDKVALLTPNCVEYLAIVFGCAKLGAVAVKLNWRLGPEELLYLLRFNDVKLLFYRYSNVQWHAQLHEMLVSEPEQMAFISLDDTEKCERSYKQFISGRDGTFNMRFFSENAPLMHLHTSGASGRPKTVVYSHRGFTDQIGTCADGLRFYEGMVFLAMCQMFHSASSGIYACIAVGAQAVLFNRFDPQEYLKAVSEYHVNRISAMPTVLYSLLHQENIDSFDLSAVKTIGYSAAPMSPALIDAAIKKFNCGFMQSYGMTEMGSIVTILQPEDHLKDGYKHLYTVGTALRGVEIKIVDDNDDKPCPANVTGRICLKGPGMMVEYYKQPELTREVLRDGWYYSDDMGFLDEDGFLKLTGRRSDLIITGGENVFSQEVENLLARHRGVKESCVFGTPDAHWGEIVTAAVVPEKGCELDADELYKYCHDRIAGFKVPKKILVVQELPHNTVGKLNKPAIVKLFTTEKHQ